MPAIRSFIGLSAIALGVTLGAVSVASASPHPGSPVRAKGTVVSVNRSTNRITLRVGRANETFVTNSVTVVTVVTVHHATSSLAALNKGETATVTGEKIGPIKTAETVTVT